MPTHTQPNAPDGGFAYFFDDPSWMPTHTHPKRTRDYYLAWKPGPGYEQEAVTMASEAIASVRTNDNRQSCEDSCVNTATAAAAAAARQGAPVRPSKLVVLHGGGDPSDLDQPEQTMCEQLSWQVND